MGWTRKGNRKWGKARVECGGGQLGTANFSAADACGICGDGSGVRPVWLIGTKGCVRPAQGVLVPVCSRNSWPWSAEADSRVPPDSRKPRP